MLTKSHREQRAIGIAVGSSLKQEHLKYYGPKGFKNSLNRKGPNGRDIVRIFFF